PLRTKGYARYTTRRGDEASEQGALGAVRGAGRAAGRLSAERNRTTGGQGVRQRRGASGATCAGQDRGLQLERPSGVRGDDADVERTAVGGGVLLHPLPRGVPASHREDASGARAGQTAK